MREALLEPGLPPCSHRPSPPGFAVTGRRTVTLFLRLPHFLAGDIPGLILVVPELVQELGCWWNRYVNRAQFLFFLVCKMGRMKSASANEKM